jgi:hypothetical protein
LDGAKHPCACRELSYTGGIGRFPSFVFLDSEGRGLLDIAVKDVSRLPEQKIEEK